MQFSIYTIDKQDRQQDELDWLQDEHIGCRTIRIAYRTNRTGCRTSRVVWTSKIDVRTNI